MPYKQANAVESSLTKAGIAVLPVWLVEAHRSEIHHLPGLPKEQNSSLIHLLEVCTFTKISISFADLLGDLYLNALGPGQNGLGMTLGNLKAGK
jgi:hypothetical protein